MRADFYSESPGSKRLESNGPIIDVFVAVSFRQEEKLHAKGCVEQSPAKARALIDTGADLTAIPASLVKRLQLDVRGYRYVGAYDGQTAQRHDTVDVRLVSTRDHSLRVPVEAIVIDDAPDEPSALIGRDVLAQCLFLYDGVKGRFELAVLGA